MPTSDEIIEALMAVRRKQGGASGSNLAEIPLLAELIRAHLGDIPLEFGLKKLAEEVREEDANVDIALIGLGLHSDIFRRSMSRAERLAVTNKKYTWSIGHIYSLEKRGFRTIAYHLMDRNGPESGEPLEEPGYSRHPEDATLENIWELQNIMSSQQEALEEAQRKSERRLQRIERYLRGDPSKRDANFDEESLLDILERLADHLGAGSSPKSKDQKSDYQMGESFIFNSSTEPE